MVGLVVGYSLASLLARAFWPSAEDGATPGILLISIAYLWLGLAMSGPILLLGRGISSRETGRDVDAVAESRTWAELAWLIVGFYWIGLTVLIVPVRLHDSRILDTVFLGLFPIVAALVLRLFRAKLAPAETEKRDWTHLAAVVLLLTWPFAWVALILLGKNL